MLGQTDAETLQGTVVFWGSIIGQKIFAQNWGFMIGKVVKIMISED